MQTIVKKIEDFDFISQNIERIINNTVGKVLSEFKELNCEYYLSGGYALALLIAPRITSTRLPNFERNPFTPTPLESMLIDTNYYQDIDIFFKSELDFWKARSVLEKYSNGSSFIYESKNQSTYLINNTKIQIIKYVFGTPDTIMESFDFVNCSIFFDKNLNVHTHKNFYKSILQKQLEMNTFKFDKIEDMEEFKYYAEMISTRIQKYCNRYSWECSPALKRYIQAVVNYCPDITHSKSRVVGSGSSSYLMTEKENIWKKLTSIGIEIPQ